MKFKFIHNIRLAGFPIVFGLISVLVTGTLNRVMIVEMRVPVSLVGFLLALPFLVSPLRVWLGYRTDAYPLFGLRREPFIILGALAVGVAVSGATYALVNNHNISILVIGILILLFVIYGIGWSLANNTFDALITDKFKGDKRPRAATYYMIAMFVGIISGAILLGRLLDPFSEMRLLAIVVTVAVSAFIITIFAILRQEPRSAAMQSEVQEARSVKFWTTFKTMVWSDPTVRRFFLFITLTVVGTLAQDVLLEPYAGLVLNMSVAETTRLTAFWGTGALLSMGLSGAWLFKRFGYMRIVQVGLVLGVLTFSGLILTGALKLPGAFMALVFFLGISTGLTASGMRSAVLDFSTVERAGIILGVWGVAHNLGQAAGNLVSGGIVDIVRVAGGEPLTAYGLVFALEAALLFIALLLLNGIKVTEARIVSASHAHEMDVV